ncbi:MAG: SufD family Fe-S cluster assembly protein [Candidatus Eisenbacteria bacterium]|nr:SufD family Fe-S cluster assembly protein [Candidatus Eisenbacteria bacterium]
MTGSETIGPVAAGNLGHRLGEPEFLQTWRARAMEAFLATESPHRAQHLWRYTDPMEFEPEGDPFATSLDGAVIQHAGDGSGAAPLPDGVLVLPLARAASEEREAFERVFGTLVGPSFGRFEALNGAAFRSGLFVRVARNAQIEIPIALRTLIGAAPFAASRVAILVEEGATVTFTETLSNREVAGGQGTKPTQRHLHVSEMVIGAGARVHHVLVETHGAKTAALITQRARLERGAKYHPVLAAFGGALTKADVGALLAGDGSESDMSGFLSAVGRQRFDHHTVHHHLGRHTRSNLNFRTVLKDRARSAYTGLIRIEREAAFSEAYQENRNLLLSENCRAESIPELEIMTEEVQCKHGATVGPLDPAQLFYLTSRAIPRAEAVRMIVAGHFEQTLVSLPEALRVSLTELLVERLKSL